MSNMVVVNETQDVTDVLASIRKLVSEEAQARSQEALKLTPAQEVDDTLMLTPDHRVVNDTPATKLVLDAPLPSPEETPTSEDLAAPSAEVQSAPVVDEQAAPTVEDQAAPVVDEQAAPFQDEVALRALVSEMIREELQGALGNRISRNIRKLVRKEVDAAIKSQKD